MQTRDKRGTVAQRSIRRSVGHEATESEDGFALQRPTTGSPAPHSPEAILGLQHAVGNRAVQRMMTPDLQRQPAGPVVVQSLAKILGQEDELPLAKAIR
jgi:hypothetical protein